MFKACSELRCATSDLALESKPKVEADCIFVFGFLVRLAALAGFEVSVKPLPAAGTDVDMHFDLVWRPI